ncbi:bifunctional riboflavin kinase/FAD synthetase [Verrucomicrobium spinosum]|uniref:bifunctional riboflavin kinase/FAD synthetase n=1 Tax=Verrucomicrobium spinosum TaxID=2736 RepID=UPI0001745B5F|nr:bifunctional riboflavin kinase/FAD synthetase [Verrucomicrobium spinosum]
MRTHSSIGDLRALRGPVALAIGVFDGVHLGHQEVIRAAMDHAATHQGTAVVMTFDPHPLRVLRPESAPRLLCSTRHKLQILEQLGVTDVLICKFTPDFAKIDAAQFVGALSQSCQPLGFISVGYTWSFGKGRGGNIHQLMELGREFGFGVYGVPEVKLSDEVVSSTLIREAVRAADFSRAAELLGRPYTVLGEVVVGRQLGRTLGFPTANVRVENEELPPTGVYAVRVQLNGRCLSGVANLGFRPTVDSGGERSLEVHLFDQSGDFYGHQMEVAFVQKLRDERKFDGLEALKAQIALDATEARSVLQAVA